jgi:hypothetical protein
MNNARHLALALGAVAAVLIAVACQDAASPPGNITAGVAPPPPPKKDKGQCANFRLTGGGRVDAHDHQGFAKNTPESHDFATFGFQARPSSACPPTDGSGQMQWNEHNPAVFGGFAFHGRVTFFTTPTDETAGDPRCGRFGGFGRIKTRNSGTFDGVPFEVNHACDVAEPGVGNDHIKITIGDFYTRHGILSGGNIQQHRLTGNR